jgi:hypothetical protein
MDPNGWCGTISWDSKKDDGNYMLPSDTGGYLEFL